MVSGISPLSEPASVISALLLSPPVSLRSVPLLPSAATSSVSPPQPLHPSPWVPSLLGVCGLVTPFLAPNDLVSLMATAPGFQFADRFGHIPRACSLAPVVRHRRRHGFGRPTPRTRRVTNDRLSGYSIIHHMWQFLSSAERRFLAVEVDTDGILLEYAQLQASIPWQPLHSLRLPRIQEPLASMTLTQRSQLLGAALISLDFHVGNLLRCLGPEFHHGLRQSTDELQTIADLNLPDPLPGQPPVDLPMARDILHQGVPLQGTFHCPLSATQARIRYDNHPPLKAVEPDVRAKFVKEEQKCFHLLLPRCLSWFVFGLFISPISWVLKRGKGRIVIDSSTAMHDDDISSPNSQIPAPGMSTYRTNPPVHYASAWSRFLAHIFRLRTNWPEEDILMHVDDIEAAFRRVLYHPDLAAVFASVFMEFLVIPVGMIFGSRSSPSFYCILSELRSHVASVASLDDVPVPEEWQVSLPPELSAAESRSLTKVGEDPLYKDASPSDGPLLQSAFVDDNGKAELRRRILEAIRNSVAAAFLVFGSPDDDWRGACFAVDKWLSEALHEVVYLGFLVNTRTMTVSWPVDKRQEFATLIKSVLPSSTKDRRKRQPLDFARILGHVRNPALIVPSLSYVSLRLQFWFNDAIRRSKGASRNSSWWRRNQLQVPNFVWKDLRLLLSVVDSSDKMDPFWHRPIGLLIPRTTTHVAFQDASYEGLGGFSLDFGFSWRVTREELVSAGFPLPPLDGDPSFPFPADCPLQTASTDSTGAPSALFTSTTHINILEFVAAIINYWMILWRCRFLDEPEGGWVIAIMGDNTSALSWMRHAARARSLPVQRLSRLFVRLPILFNFQGKVTGAHVPGHLNTIADHLSRPLTEAPTWDSVMEQHSELRPFPACQIPPPLLSLLSRIMFAQSPEEQLEREMMELLTLEPVILAVG